MIWLIDVSSVAHRMHYALPETLYTGPTGKRTGALSGFVREMRTLRRKHSAELILPVLDGGRGWRAELFPGYKGDREEPPVDLAEQLERLPDLIRAMCLEPAVVDDVEADDLIASYTEAAVARGWQVTIVSNDKDLQQLVRGDQVRVLAKREFIGPREVEDHFGVRPDRLADLLALMGDKSDSIPGVAGIGKATALRLLAEHGSLDDLLARWSLVAGKLAYKIRDGADAARMSRTLVRLRTDIPLPVALDDLSPWSPSRSALDEFFAGYGFARFEAAVDPAPE